MNNQYNHIEELTKELLEMTGDIFVYPEFFPHEDKIMWKINNPFTKLREDKLVLCAVEDGLEKALTVAVAKISKRKNQFLGKVERSQTA